MKLTALEKELTPIYQELVNNEPMANVVASAVHPKYRLSAKNLFRYLLIRSYDLRKIHDSLTEFGISSLRTSEGYVYQNISNALKIVHLLKGRKWEPSDEVEFVGFTKSKNLLQQHANNLFNETTNKHFTEIMVTMPTEASEDTELLKALILEGMEVARINLSHDDMDTWQKMVANIRKVSEELGRSTKIYIDLAGPKIRIAEIEILKKKKKSKTKNFVKIKDGDRLIITKRKTKGEKAVYDKSKILERAAIVGVTLPQIIDDIKVGDMVFFDDGMIEAKVLSKTEDEAELEILKAHKSKLKSEKGINLPNTRLNLPSLTDRDIELLPFITEHADIIGFSFVRQAKDVKRLYEELDKLDKKNIGIVFKIENGEAFENLPLILFEAMKKPKIGVMIARGDLAVEIGFERISEVQQQILWFCEAAHIPVIWATQVLENLAKTGVATRAEISDASISVQAECVMLNKGPYIVDTVRMLKDILIKMEKHSSKKKNTMRKLHVARLTLRKLSAMNNTKRS